MQTVLHLRRRLWRSRGLHEARASTRRYFPSPPPHAAEAFPPSQLQSEAARTQEKPNRNTGAARDFFFFFLNTGCKCCIFFCSSASSHCAAQINIDREKERRFARFVPSILALPRPPFPPKEAKDLEHSTQKLIQAPAQDARCCDQARQRRCSPRPRPAAAKTSHVFQRC